MRRVLSIVQMFVLGSLIVAPGRLAAQANDVKPRVIVFVHGLHGDRDTWRAPNGTYWPQLVQTDPLFQRSDVVVASYPTPSSNGRLSTQQLSEILWQGLNKQRVWQHNEVVFITHSLGGLVTEEMLLNHPNDASRVAFMVSYSTPHQGSFVANLAKIYDGDPLLTDLSTSNDNSFLIDLEQHWRGTPAVNRIHRFCAYETLDTNAGEGIGRLLRAHVRVVDSYSATYGCDVDTPAQKIAADHISIVKPANRSADAYTFFATIYRKNPIRDVVISVRDNKVAALTVDCNKTNAATDLQVPIALNPALHEQVIGATAEIVDADKIRDVSSPVVTKVDPFGIAHISYSFQGKGRNLLLGCPGGEASIVVHFQIRSEVPEL